MKSMNKKLHIGIYLTSLVLPVPPLIAFGWLTYLGFDRNSYGCELYILVLSLLISAGLQFFIVQTFYNFFIPARMWDAIRDADTGITAGRAVGFMFIPVFNLYWIFRVWGSFPTEYKSHIKRRRINAPRIFGGVFLAYPVLLLLTPFLFIPALVLPFVFIMVISETCDAVNALGKNGERSRRLDPAAPQPHFYVQFQMPHQYALNA